MLSFILCPPQRPVKARMTAPFDCEEDRTLVAVLVGMLRVSD
jgi:hypothetical protein